MGLLVFHIICWSFSVGSILLLTQNRAFAAPTDFEINTVLLARAMSLADLNNWVEAEPIFRLAEEKSRRVGNKRDNAFARLGLIRSTAQQRTLPQTLRDLERMRALDPLVHSDKRLYLFYLGIKAEVDGEMRSSAARQDWEAVAEVARDLGNLKWENRSLAGVGMAAFYDGDLTTARKNISAALVSATQNHDVGSQIQYLYAVGNGLAATQLDAQALSYFDKAISLALTTPNAGYPFMVNLAKCAALVRLGQVSEAKKAVFGILETAQRRRTPVYEAATLTALADIDHRQGDLAKAASYLEQSVEICRKGGFVRNLVDAQLSLADVYAEQRKWPKAEQVLVEAVNGAQSNGDLSTLPDRLRILAEIQVAQGKFALAERTYQKASTFVDGMIAGDAAILDKTAWVRIASRLYVEHFALAAEHGTNPAYAFSILEQVRGRAFTDFLLGGSTTSKRARETETAISKARFQLLGAKTNGDISKIRDRLFLLEQSRWINPDVSVLKARWNSRIELSKVQSAMSSEAVILEFVLAEPKSFCLVITRDSAQVMSLAPKKQIELLANSFLSAVKSRQPGTQEARGLYDALLAPLAPFIGKEDILVVRDGVLHRLPFDALVSAAGDSIGFNHVVSYLPSGTSFYLLAREATKSRSQARNLFAVGDIPYQGLALSQSGERADRSSTGNSYYALPNSRQEVNAAAASFGNQRTTLLTGAAATKAAIKEAELGQYRVLHFAVHGLADDIHPDRASLVLLSDSNAGEDGLLSATEIAQLRLSADLVILSACDTAVGPIEGQGGIATLSRSFMLAGARSVISTLWAVDDDSSLALLKEFYEQFKKTAAPAESLALAKRVMLAKFGKAIVPYYWAAFSFEGLPKSAIANHARK